MSAASSDAIQSQLRQNLSRIERNVLAACQRRNRDAKDVQLVVVTKSTDLKIVNELVALGQHALGENRPQQLIDRAGQLPSVVNWHLIGQLQRNKVRAVLPHVRLIHSVDSWRLLDRIEQVAEELNLQPNVLLQVNVSGEQTKSGFEPNELSTGLENVCKWRHVHVAGLMTMAPFTENEEVIRDTFSGLRQLRDELKSTLQSVALHELSMGMSHDYEIAIEEGATLIRIGSAVFEGCEDLGECRGQ